MKKAKIILSAIAILAVTGGAFAFKAMRFTGTPAWQETTTIFTYVSGTRTYTAGPLAYCTILPGKFFLPQIGSVQNLRTTEPAQPLTVTSASFTLTIPYYSVCSPTLSVTTNVN